MAETISLTRVDGRNATTIAADSAAKSPNRAPPAGADQTIDIQDSR